MEKYLTIDNLQQLKSDLLTLKATNSDISDFLRAMEDVVDFSDDEFRATVLEICYLLQLTNTDIPLLKLTLQALLARIILRSTELDLEESTNDNAVIQKCETKSEVANLKQLIINKYSPFSRDGRLIFPDEGDFGNVQFVATEIDSTGKEYKCDVQIDHNGNILKFLQGPIEMIVNQDYESIYAGLIGKLLEYQK